MTEHRTILVTGATGRVGCPLVHCSTTFVVVEAHHPADAGHACSVVYSREDDSLEKRAERLTDWCHRPCRTLVVLGERGECTCHSRDRRGAFGMTSTVGESGRLRHMRLRGAQHRVEQAGKAHL